MCKLKLQLLGVPREDGARAARLEVGEQGARGHRLAVRAQDVLLQEAT
jgi:hypothetical protein